MYVKVGMLLAPIILCSCTWVSLSKEGETVMVKTISDVSECKKVAHTTASLRSKVMGVDRNTEKVKAELEILARNAAIEYGGNVVVPSSDIEEGKQTFDVYKC